MQRLPEFKNLKLLLTFHGPAIATWSDGKRLSGLGAKHIAILAMLANSPNKVRTRSWLIAQLWGRVDQRLGRSSLRQAMTTLRHAFGERFDLVFDIETDRIALIDANVELCGGPELGEFLEGIDIDEEGFEDWLRDQRMHSLPAQVAETQAHTNEKKDESLLPTIAVLPMTFYGDGPQDAEIGDFVAQEMIRALSRSNLMNVISHLSSRTFSSASLNLEEVNDALSADFLATGVIQQRSERAILSIDLTDCATGTHVWGERFSLPMSAFFENECKIVLEVVGEIVRVILGEAVRLGLTRPLPDLPSHRLLMSSVALMFNVSRDRFFKARSMMDELASRATLNSIVPAWSAQWRLLEIYQGWSAQPGQSLQLAKDELAAGLDMNPSCPTCLSIDGNVKTVLEADFDQAAISFDNSLAVNRSSALTCSLKCVLHTFLGDGPEAVRLAGRSEFLSPRDPRAHFFASLHASAYVVNQDYERGLELVDVAMRSSPNHISAHRTKVVALVGAGEMSDARAAAKKLMQLTPDMRVSSYLANHAARRSGVADAWADALLQAGVPN